MVSKISHFNWNNRKRIHFVALVRSSLLLLHRARTYVDFVILGDNLRSTPKAYKQDLYSKGLHGYNYPCLWDGEKSTGMDSTYLVEVWTSPRKYSTVISLKKSCWLTDKYKALATICVFCYLPNMVPARATRTDEGSSMRVRLDVAVRAVRGSALHTGDYEGWSEEMAGILWGVGSSLARLS